MTIDTVEIFKAETQTHLILSDCIYEAREIINLYKENGFVLTALSVHKTLFNNSQISLEFIKEAEE